MVKATSSHPLSSRTILLVPHHCFLTICVTPLSLLAILASFSLCFRHGGAVIRHSLPRQIQRHLSPLVLRLDVGVGLLDQKIDCFQMADVTGIAQRRSAPHLILRLDVGAGVLPHFPSFDLTSAMAFSTKSLMLLMIGSHLRVAYGGKERLQ